MSWNADDPQGSMQVSQRVYIDEATCLAAGAERQRMVDESGDTSREFVWRCKRHQSDIEIYRPLTASE